MGADFAPIHRHENMTHDQLSVQSETGRATAKLIATLFGGVLLLASFAAQEAIEWPDLDARIADV